MGGARIRGRAPVPRILHGVARFREVVPAALLRPGRVGSASTTPPGSVVASFPAMTAGWLVRAILVLAPVHLAACATPPPADPIPLLPAAVLGIVETRGLPHRVEPGETWYGIARRYGVDLERLLLRNGESLGRGRTPVLRAGDTIFIPRDPPEFRNVHRVSEGESGRRNDRPS